MGMKKWWKLGIVMGLSLACTWLGTVVHTETVQATGEQTKRDSQKRIEQIQEEYQTILDGIKCPNDEDLYASLPNVLQSPYRTGELKASFQQQTVDYINFLRRFNSLEPISVSEDDAKIAQQAAAGMASISTMAHGLPETQRPSFISEADWKAASEGTNKSNLLMTGSGIQDVMTPIDIWMADRGGNNQEVGHRSWILCSNLASTGIGIAKGASGASYAALKVIGNYTEEKPNPTKVVTWPSEDLFPMDYLTDDYRWSIHFASGSVKLDKNVAIQLKNKRTQETWYFNSKRADGEFHLGTTGYGHYTTITFVPQDIHYQTGDQFEVSVTGLSGEMESYQYQVELFDLIPVQPVPMHRVYNPNSGEHFYTEVASEKDHLVKVGWKYEGIGWNAPSKGDIVYRLYNPNSGDHHYTTDFNEARNLDAIGWWYEGIGWYSDPNQEIPVYRAYNPNAFSGSHNYTTSSTEQRSLIKAGWKDENIGWYGISK